MKATIYHRGEPIEVLIDAEDYALFRSRRWHRKATVRRDLDGNLHQTAVPGYETTIAGKRYKTTLPRLILGAGKGEKVRHRNGNGMDCRRCNLVKTSKKTVTRAFCTAGAEKRRERL